MHRLNSLGRREVFRFDQVRHFGLCENKTTPHKVVKGRVVTFIIYEFKLINKFVKRL